ncbi:MAG: hypothetical protein BHW64_01160 [Candidatus Melainabacteria bacterium LEY3_CP_29_8]|nr:MAG: hypothetical protein BHW64_01160 [Candidatus Melainabacteria bacterium LEY3_CP_29_8]
MGIYRKTLNKISNVLNNLNYNDSNLHDYFDNLYEIVKFDGCALFYLSLDKISLVEFKNFTKKKILFDIIQRDIPFDNELYLILNNKNTYKLNLNDKLIQHILFQDKNKIKFFDKDFENKKFLITNLRIKSTSFGFLLLEKDNDFSEDEINVINAYSSIMSYQIKDKELSEVFKMQLKILENNIVEKTQAYKKIEEQNEKIVEANKAKNEFLANISHELRTPLNSIIGFSEVLKEGIIGDLNDKQKEYINDIYVSGVHLLGMINEILDISKIESNAMNVNYSKFDLNMSINEVINVIKPLSQKKNITLTCDIKPNIELEADYQKIQQILYNLLSNAIKFTPNNGEISIITDFEDDFVIIKIKDTGIGIDSKYLGKIFGKFVQLHSVYTKKESSTGLGLTITKELVELHKGKIYVESKINEGSTFIVKLPQNTTVIKD